MNEFELIDRFFAGAATDARVGIGDDAAIVQPSPGCDLHLAVDAMVSGRHFFADADPRGLGHKALAVNLSDMAAMGATPRWALLSLALPAVDQAWLTAFAEGFFALARRYGVSLVGGDTTAGPLTLSVTIAGETRRGAGLLRSAATVGDDVWVSGSLGLAALALHCYQADDLLPPPEVLARCRLKMHQPEPRVDLGRALVGLAHAAIDVSDGFLADLGHILSCSGVGAEVWLDALPTDPWLGERRQALAAMIAAGGDDYELCFTAPVAVRDAIGALSGLCPVSRVGRIVAGGGVRLLAADGQVIELGRTGFDHFQS